MSDWKSIHGVTDEGAHRAGIYGQPNSTWDIARAQEESWKTQSTSPTHSTTPLYNPPSYSPIPLATSGFDSEADGCLAILKGLAFCAIIITVAFLLVNADKLAGLLPLSTNIGFNASELDTSHYESLSDSAVALSSTPASRLYESRLKTAKSDWTALSKSQRLAVQASWIRYTRDPTSFTKLAAKQRSYFAEAFESYLLNLSSTGDQNATEDLRHLKLLQR